MLALPFFTTVSGQGRGAGEDEYPQAMLAALDSLTVQLNQNCSKYSKEKCFDPALDALSTEGIPFTPAQIQARMDLMESGIPMEYNQHVKSFINLYGVRKKQLTERIMTLSEYYFPMFEEILDREGLPQEFKYLAVIESALNPQAQSWAGACGLWQFIHSTGLAYGMKIGPMVDERRDPIKSTLAACQYFKNSYALYGDWLLVIASYNCGPGNVNKAIRKSGGKKNFWQIMKYLPKETRGYVPALIAAAFVMENADALGLKKAEFDVHDMVENVEVDRVLHFGQLQKVLGIPMDDLVYLNPEYKKKIIPASTHTKHELTLPYKYAMRFAEMKDSIYALKVPTESYEDVAEYASVRKVHTVKKGETLARIARKNGVRITDLKAWNVIKGNYVKPGRKLVVYVKQKKKPGSPAPGDKEDIKLNINPEVAKSDEVADTVQADVVDTVIKVKTKTPAPKKLPVLVYHKVAPGDTLYSISKKYPGLTIEKLRVYNKLSKDAILKPGVKLKIAQ